MFGSEAVVSVEGEKSDRQRRTDEFFLTQRVKFSIQNEPSSDIEGSLLTGLEQYPSNLARQNCMREIVAICGWEKGSCRGRKLRWIVKLAEKRKGKASFRGVGRLVGWVWGAVTHARAFPMLREARLIEEVRIWAVQTRNRLADD